MIHRDSSRVLDESGELVPDRRPPPPDLMAMARASTRRRNHRRNGLVAAIAGASLASAALFYGHFDDGSPESGDRVASGGYAASPVISMSEDGGGFPAAEVAGELKLVGGCLMLDSSAVFWPHGTTWDSQARAVVFPDDSDTPALEVGSRFAGGGGYYTVDQAIAVLGAQYREPLGACAEKARSDQVIYAVPAS